MTNDKNMTDQSEKFDDELLSAYVDGELTGEQLAQVERRLADDPQAQKLVDELRALGTEIQSLPRQTVGEDLRATIMQRAERAMLLGTEEQQATLPSETSFSGRWKWAVMALAATLLMSLYLPNAQQEEKPLASAKPVPKEDSAEGAELQLEAVEEKAADFEEEKGLVAQSGGGGVGGAMIDSSSVADVAAESLPRAVMAPAGVVASKELVVEEESADEGVPPDCQVFLTLSDGANSFKQFHQLLVSNGITMEEPTAGASYAATSRDRSSSRSSKMKTQPVVPQEEMVLVEATAEQIENLLEAYNTDTQNFASVRLLAEENKAEPSSAPIKQWQQWERSGKQLAPSKLKQLRRTQQAAKQSQQGQSLEGRALRLETNQYQRQSNGLLNLDRNLLAKKKLAKHPPIQVLFILQHPHAPGEPAPAGGNR